MGRSSVLTADNFADIANRASIDLVLSRLAKRGTIRRIARGLYLYPKAGPHAGEAAPSVQSVASAIAKAGRMRLLPSGAHAANLLGLSEQVPMKVVFLTDGGSRRILVGRREIIFRRSTPRNMAAAGRLGGLVVQALRYLGPSAVNDSLMPRLRAVVPEAERREVLKDALSAPAWIRRVLMSALTAVGPSMTVFTRPVRTRSTYAD